jgi:TPR repeat protein
MSYIINIWEQPRNLPIPETETAIWQMLSQLYEMQPRQNPKFQELARQLMSIYPEESGDEGDRSVWLECKADGDTNEPVWNLGLYNGERLDEAQAMITALATGLGLNVADEQAGDLYLADGRILSPRAGAYCMKAFAAYFSGQHTKAWQEFLSLATRGNLSALRNLASMSIRGEAVKKNYQLGYALLVLAGETDEAQRLHRALKAEAQANAEALLQVLLQPGRFLTTIQRLAIPTASSAELTLEPTVAASLTTPNTLPDSTKIALLLEKAKAGDNDARVYLASAYKTGEGIAPSNVEAVRWWTLAAQEGIAEAQFNLALSYAFGHGVAKDDKSAFKWYGQAADQGHANAIYNFGVMHTQGVVVPKDLVAANLLYAYALVKGCEHAPTPTFNPANAAHALPLLKELSESGKVLDTLNKWRRIQAKQQNVNSLELKTFSQATQTKNTRSTSSENSSDSEQEPAVASSLHIGHAALLVGVLQMPIFIWLMPSTMPVIGKLMLAFVSLTAAYSAWRVARDQEFSSGVTILIVLLALMPMIGMLPCLGLLLKVVRQKTS